MTDAREFLLPDLGEGLTEGEIVSWLVAVGDTVEVDQPVAEVETAKAVVEVPSPFAGVVVALHAEVGQEVEVGKRLLTVAHAPEPVGSDGDGGSGNVLVGYGTRGAGSGARRRRASGSDESGGETGGVLAKPPVRKFAKDAGVELADVPASGPHGSVTREDVQAFLDRRATARPSSPYGVVVTDAQREPLGSAPPNEERIPVRGVRRAIAERMTTSRQEIPEATTWVDCDATPLLELREQLNAGQDRVRVSAFALVLRAAVAGLREHPTINSRLDTRANEIVVARHVHLGFAAQTDRGLVVPVIRDAQRRSTLGIAEELRRLTGVARGGTATAAELTGSTFTVSNYGAFGVDGGSPIINHPEAAILGLGRIADRPWVVDGQVVARKVVQLSIAFDHRICDGGEAAAFLRFVADCVERPAFLIGAL